MYTRRFRITPNIFDYSENIFYSQFYFNLCAQDLLAQSNFFKYICPKPNPLRMKNSLCGSWKNVAVCKNAGYATDLLLLPTYIGFAVVCNMRLMLLALFIVVVAVA